MSVKSGTPPRFRRRGEVRARVLDADRRWRTSSGSWVLGRAGDWWVEGDDTSPRSVAAAEFASLYASIGEDHFRRIGEVSATRCTIEQVVPTLEGDVVAQPGMWIVTDDRGNSWPVPDDGFRKSYEPV